MSETRISVFDRRPKQERRRDARLVRCLRTQVKFMRMALLAQNEWLENIAADRSLDPSDAAQGRLLGLGWRDARPFSEPRCARRVLARSFS